MESIEIKRLQIQLEVLEKEKSRFKDKQTDVS